MDQMMYGGQPGPQGGPDMYYAQMAGAQGHGMPMQGMMGMGMGGPMGMHPMNMGGYGARPPGRLPAGPPAPRPCPTPAARQAARMAVWPSSSPAWGWATTESAAAPATTAVRGP